MKKGFTLVEMLVAMAIFAVLMTMSYAVILTAQKVSARGASMRDVQTEARNIIDLISRDIKSDTFCGLDSNDNSITITTKSGTSPCTLNPDSKIYSLNTTNLLLNYSIAGKSVVAQQVNSNFLKVTKFEITGNNNSFVNINASFESLDKRNPYKFDIQTTISPEQY